MMNVGAEVCVRRKSCAPGLRQRRTCVEKCRVFGFRIKWPAMTIQDPIMSISIMDCHTAGHLQYLNISRSTSHKIWAYCTGSEITGSLLNFVSFLSTQQESLKLLLLHRLYSSQVITVGAVLPVYCSKHENCKAH